MDPMSNAIELESVRHKAGSSFEIRDLSLRVPHASIYGFLGPNGSGKTTTIRLLMGMHRASAGKISVLGHSIPQETTRALARIGYVPERPHLYSALTVEESVRYHASFFKSWDEAWGDDLLGRMRLNTSQRVGRLSKGETGKLLMVLALAQKPQLLILDEPTDGLDPVARREVMTAVLDYVSEADATVFISSHLVHELERICDWVGVLDNGSLVAELPMQSFKDGIKRIRVVDPPEQPGDTPFVLLSRTSDNGLGPGETWTVRGWQPPMTQYFEGVGATLREVVDLDLEEGFVELLRSSRPNPTRG